jgi:hypothetical protein
VNDLMIEGLKHWDYNKIINLFSHDAAEPILFVPLISELKEDKLVWQEEKNGEYTVKSGYRLLLLMKANEERRCRGTTGSWRSLWQICAPPKAKHMLWRICRDCLPTRVQLRQHHVQCPLLDVITARLNAFHNVKDVIFDICSKESKEVAGRVGTLIWMIWNNRNQWIWNQEKKDATQVGIQAFHMWHDWYKVQNFNNSIPDGVQVQQQYGWLPPRQTWLKCNVDAGFHHDGRIMSGGWCIRDERSILNPRGRGLSSLGGYAGSLQ